ncbi:MAG: hypothetical protein M3Y41_15840 [Pseudomonadota bacterium]|nr:hypothetical protein [Pseudomonadota bacterium]
MLDADPEPGLLCRLLHPFAKRGLVPDRMWSHLNGGTLHVEIALDAAPAEYVLLIEGNLRQVVGVRSVTQVRRNAILRAA